MLLSGDFPGFPASRTSRVPVPGSGRRCSMMLHGAGIFTNKTNWVILAVSVGKCSSTMEHSGFVDQFVFCSRYELLEGRALAGMNLYRRDLRMLECPEIADAGEDDD